MTVPLPVRIAHNASYGGRPPDDVVDQIVKVYAETFQGRVQVLDSLNPPDTLEAMSGIPGLRGNRSTENLVAVTGLLRASIERITANGFDNNIAELEKMLRVVEDAVVRKVPEAT